MQYKATGALGTGTNLSLRRAAELWLSDGRARGWSPHTLRDRHYLLARLIWWLENEAETPATLACPESFRGVRAFLAYVARGHQR